MLSGNLFFRYLNIPRVLETFLLINLIWSAQSRELLITIPRNLLLSTMSILKPSITIFGTVGTPFFFDLGYNNLDMGSER